MKKSILWFIVLVVCVSLISTFSLIGCKEEVSEEAPAEEVKEEVSEEAPAEEVKEEVSEEALKFSGVKLNANIETGPHGQAFKPIAEEWAEANGVEISWTELPGWPEMFQKTLLELEAGEGVTDLMQVSSVWMSQIGEYLEPLGKYLDAYGIDTDNFVPGVAVDAATINGELIGFPLAAESFPYAYREDIFEKYGVDKIPETLDELLEAAKKVNHPEDGIYGFAGMAKRGVFPYWHYITFLRAMGGDVFDANGKPALDSDIALEAMEYMQELYKYTDPASSAWSHFESYDSFGKTGSSAQILLWDGGYNAWIFAPGLEFGAVSGATKCPGVEIDGEMNYGQPIQVWYMAINSNSENKDAAMDVLNYVAYKEAVQYTIKSSYVTTKMAKEDPEVKVMFPILDAVLGAMEDASVEPGGAHYMEMADIIGTEVSAILVGTKSPVDGLAAANDKLMKIFE